MKLIAIKMALERKGSGKKVKGEATRAKEK